MSDTTQVFVALILFLPLNCDSMTSLSRLKYERASRNMSFISFFLNLSNSRMPRYINFLYPKFIYQLYTLTFTQLTPLQHHQNNSISMFWPTNCIVDTKLSISALFILSLLVESYTKMYSA